MTEFTADSTNITADSSGATADQGGNTFAGERIVISGFDTVIAPRAKFAAAIKPIVIDLHRILRTYWVAEQFYNGGAVVRAPSVAGLAYVADGGEAGSTEPSWARAIGGKTKDGSLSWTAIAAGTNAMDPIASAVWSLVNPPDGVLTISGQATSIELCVAVFTAGTAGKTYRVHMDATGKSGLVYSAEFDLEVL